ncbi:uncharacterized protein LOC135814671 isoform X1 [Sycon ciliatum]|uniref:uncharacterized protein LOC135814671 isoform X1 n=1 Tax=Sycon ciliatum TaxID=27933 RepID=UPI0031F6EA24
MLPRYLFWLVNVIAAALCNASPKDGQAYYPGDTTPDFNLPTLSGVNFNGVVHGQRLPVVFYRYDERSLFILAEWHTESSVEDFVKHAPRTTHFVFMASKNAKEVAPFLNSSLVLASAGDKQLLDRCHIIPVDIGDLDDKWIGEVFQQWKCIDHGCGSDSIIFTQGKETASIPRLDARYDFVPEIIQLGAKSFPVVHADTCHQSVQPKMEVRAPGSFVPAPWLVNKDWKMPAADPSANYSGQFILTSSTGCDQLTKLQYAKQQGAAGLIIYSGKQATAVNEIVCHSERECNLGPGLVPATGISYDSVDTVLELLSKGPVTLTFNKTDLPHFYFMSDYFGKLAEGGWFLYPSLMFLDFEAHWFDYTARLDRRLNAPAKTIPLIPLQEMHGPAGANVTVSLPSFEDLRKYQLVELHTSFSCPGRFDLDCAIWDRTVGLSICCTGQEAPFCDYELGRWITPFRRRIGHWLTDVTPLLPLLKSTNGKCSLAMRTDPWAQPWMVSVSLRLQHAVPSCKSGEPCLRNQQLLERTVVDENGAALAPESMISVMQHGAAFDKHYNNRSAVAFTVPAGTHSVRLVSVITGHGSDENGCGEFCVTQHVFTVNGQHNNSIEFNTAGTPLGCALNVPNGVVPNEHGTWLYGRDGWCDGQEVDPWVVDITNQVKMDGSKNTVFYQGYFNGKTPNPEQNPGYMAVYSELVFYSTV